MAELLRPTDRPMMSLREAMDRLFEQSFTSPFWVRTWSSTNGWHGFPVNVYEDNERYYVHLAVPGATPDSFEITVKEDELSIAGEVKPQLPEGAKPTWQEWQPTTFRRQISLGAPVEADKAQVSYEYGVLYLTLPKAEKVRTKTIKVQSAK